MEYGNDKHRMLIENFPDAFAYCQVVLDSEDIPADYVLLDVNQAFENMFGLKREEVIGKKIKEKLSPTNPSIFNLIDNYRKTTIAGTNIRFELYDELLEREYEITAYSDAIGFIATIFRDISSGQGVTNTNEKSRQACKITPPSLQEDDMEIKLENIINTEEIQSLMEDFYNITNLPMSIIDNKGKVLVGIGWQNICTQFHRVHPETLKHCIESDTKLIKGVSPGEFKIYKCKNNIWDIATPIMVNGIHVGNIFMGQFFFDDETVDYELFRTQARKYGFDEKKYLQALQQVPRFRREIVHQAMSFFTKLAHLISTQGHINIRLSRALGECKQAGYELSKSEEFRKRVFESSRIPIIVMDASSFRYIDCNNAAVEVYGYSTKEEVLGLTPLHVSAPLQYDGTSSEEAAMSYMQQAISEGFVAFEWKHQRPDGCIWDAEVHLLSFFIGERAFLQFSLVDITDRKQAEKALNYRLQFEKLVSKISSMFINLPPEEIDEGINYALKLIGEFFHVDRSYVFQFFANEKTMSNTHEWCAEGIKPVLGPSLILNS